MRAARDGRRVRPRLKEPNVLTVAPATGAPSHWNVARRGLASKLPDDNVEKPPCHCECGAAISGQRVSTAIDGEGGEEGEVRARASWCARRRTFQFWLHDTVRVLVTMCFVRQKARPHYRSWEPGSRACHACAARPKTVPVGPDISVEMFEPFGATERKVMTNRRLCILSARGQSPSAIQPLCHLRAATRSPLSASSDQFWPPPRTPLASSLCLISFPSFVPPLYP